MDNRIRCSWLDNSQIYIKYHDEEWSIPVHDDIKLFEILTLESFQSGLMWITILKKRENFKIAFDQFDPYIVANYSEQKVEELMINEGIIRHRGKILAAINNAKLFLDIQKSFGSFDKFVWSYVDNKPLINNNQQFPTATDVSILLSKDLKKMGFKFLGSTTVYAFMEASGMIYNHMPECYLHISNKDK